MQRKQMKKQLKKQAKKNKKIDYKSIIEDNWLIEKLNLDSYYYLINHTEDFRDLFKKSRSKDFVQNVDEEAENQLMEAWDKFFTAEEKEIL